MQFVKAICSSSEKYFMNNTNQVSLWCIKVKFTTMKKIILFALILISIPAFVIINSTKKEDSQSNSLKDEKWEYVKERIFNGSNEEVKKFSGPILCELYDATSKDSAAVKKVLKELKELLPNKDIEFFKIYAGKLSEELALKKSNNDLIIKGYNYSDLEAHVIKLYFKETTPYNGLDYLGNEDFLKRNTSNYSFKTIKKQKGFHISIKNENKNSSKEIVNDLMGVENPNFHFKFSNNQSLEDRFEAIRFYFVRTIAVANFFPSKSKKVVDSKESILNNGKPISFNIQFTELDKFLLQKLYSPNLIEEFKTYLFNSYSWHYARNFVSKRKMNRLANWTFIILGTLYFIFGFSVFYKRNYKYNYFYYLIPIFVVFVCVINMVSLHSYIKSSNETNFKTYLFIFFLFLFIAIYISVLLMLFDKYIIKNSMNFTVQNIFKMGFTFITYISPVVLVLIARNQNEDWLNQLDVFLVLAFVVALGRGLLLYLNHFSENLIKQKDVELSNLKALKSQAEVKLLQSQINPHFLYNALNSIASLAQTDGVKTEKMALSLSDLFKYSINRKGKKNSTVGDEVDMVKNYLEVEQVRFGDRLTFHIKVEESLTDVKIPMFLIQPLIENAVKHGVSKIENDGKIELKIVQHESDITITVHDNGSDFPDGLVSGHGLQTVYDLLRLSYGENAALSWTNTPKKGIVITIKNIIKDE